MEKLILLVLAVTGAFSRCGGDPVPLALPPGEDGSGGSVTTATEDGGAAPTTSSTATTGGEGGEGGAGGEGGTGGAGGAGAVSPGPVGTPCDSSVDCLSGLCRSGPNAGMCSAFCEYGSTCGEGGNNVCAVDGYCYLECKEGDPQHACAAGQVCDVVGSAWVCVPEVW